MRKPSKQTIRVLQFYRESCSGLDMAAARKRIQQRFPAITNARWYRLKPALNRLSQQADQPLTGPPAALCNPPPFEPQLTIPNDTTPEAKVAISQLIAINSQQECRIQTQQVENSALRDRVGRSESRNRVLVEMLKVVLAHLT